MILFNVRDLASQIFFGIPPENKEVRLFLARSIIDAAVEIFNYPGTENTLITDLEEKWELEFDILHLNDIVIKLVTEIKQRTRGYGWDPRCLAKLEYMGPTDGRGMLMARVIMDLEETFAKINEQIAPEVDKEGLSEFVSDNPNMETLNELSKIRVRETQRPFELLSGRSQPFVRSDEERGWRTIDWDLQGHI